MATTNFEPLPDYGDLMTLAEFKQYLDDGSINSDDGTGYFATATQMSRLTAFGLAPEWATHVMWFNN